MTKRVNNIRRLPKLFYKSTTFALIEVILSLREQIKQIKAELKSILASHFKIIILELQFTGGVTKTETESIAYKPWCFSWFCRETLTCCRMASHPYTNKFTIHSWSQRDIIHAFPPSSPNKNRAMLKGLQNDFHAHQI